MHPFKNKKMKHFSFAVFLIYLMENVSEGKSNQIYSQVAKPFVSDSRNIVIPAQSFFRGWSFSFSVAQEWWKVNILSYIKNLQVFNDIRIVTVEICLVTDPNIENSLDAVGGVA